MDMELKNIYKAYNGNTVLKDFSCCIPSGSICAVTAPSGSGKTTLLRLILGLEAPDSGTISGVPEGKAALFQEDRLIPALSLLQNLRMVLPKCPKTEMNALLDRLGLTDSLRKPAAQLSGGMSRRAALARALLAPGELLTLDEPFTGLDEANRLIAAREILALRRGRTLLLVTHRQDDLELLGVEQVIHLD